MRKQFGNILIETLLTLSILLIISLTGIITMDSLLTNRIKLEDKIDNYVTLNKFVKYTAQLTGIKSKITIETNKIKAVFEFSNNETKNIPLLRQQVDELNYMTLFDSVDTNVITYLPDGSTEESNPIQLYLENDMTNIVLISINEWDEIDIIYTNKVDVELEMEEDY